YVYFFESNEVLKQYSGLIPNLYEKLYCGSVNLFFEKKLMIMPFKNFNKKVTFVFAMLALHNFDKGLKTFVNHLSIQDYEESLFLQKAKIMDAENHRDMQPWPKIAGLAKKVIYVENQ
ncbi:10680_t:CDS:2, partial [Scutellospora calospora]